ncbi:Gfo/Idh/MocA family oxidoreductase [Lujinxingia vulgaris]|uniref:Gfo/Idh/MocA family oxidoreductase n=2 Tax=Lujinxingia vulgaris TaxID=2600176 RepID=A0A5C6X4M5_9DELT|nr:Gfo/Idh/MocA family oxidoreductase [Lujinxingia vulgaris]
MESEAETSMARLKVGIVGAGSISELHARGYQEDPRAEIVAVCDRDEDRAIQRSLDWGARAYYTNFSEMLENKEIDAVEILTPHYLHASQVIDALQAGKHVSVERPLALSIEEANQVVQTARQVGKIVQVYEPCLFYKPLLDARNLIDAGEIGKPTGIRVAMTVAKGQSDVWDFASIEDEASLWRFDPQLSGGSPMLYDVGYQTFCIALFLIGNVEKIEVWRSETAIREGLKLDAPTVAMWKHFQQDCYGTMTLNYAPERKLRTPYHPLEATIAVEGTRGTIDIIRSSDPTQLEAPVELRRDSRKVAYGQRNTAFEDSFVRATRNFIGACLGEEDPLLGANEARQLLLLTLAYQESSRRGRAVNLQHG